MKHKLELEIARTGGPPVFLQIARGIAVEIENSRLQPGDQLPSIRELSAQLHVHRKTVAAAVAELEAQGFVVRRARSGIFVSQDFPELKPLPKKRNLRAEPGFDLPSLPPRPTSSRAEFDLLGGMPELDGLPKRELACAYRRALVRDRGNKLIDYNDCRGDIRLRGVLSEWLARTRGVRAGIDSINVVRGTQHGLYLAVRALLRPGDAVAIEAYAHPAISSLFRLVGVELIPVPLDRDGLRIDALEALCERRPIRALYTTPHHQLPTTVTMTAPRRMQLLELARRRRFMILEDDYDHEFQYSGPPVMPLAHADRNGVVVYFGSLSKVVAPGLRAAFVVSTPPVMQRLAEYRTFVDRQGDHVMERALAELLEDGDIERHIRRMLRVYRSRRDAMREALAAELPELRFAVPSGGMAIWAEAPGVDVDAWVQRSLRMGVSFQPASLFACGEVPLNFVRLGFAACDEDRLREAIRRMARAIR